MSETLLERSARFIDEGIDEGKASKNPTDGSFHEIADGIGLVCGFSHILSVHTDDGHVLFDTSMEEYSTIGVDALEGWRPGHFDTIVYTHGHFDHVSGTDAFVAANERQGTAAPRVIGHEKVTDRFDRYKLTDGYNTVINQRQFGWGGSFYRDWVRPDTTYTDRLELSVGGTDIVLNHDRGETDDHTWAWVPEHRAIFAGDLLRWLFPNAGNPQKVQRYAADWAGALRSMAALEPDLILGAHGLPIGGGTRIATVLDDTATALEGLQRDTLAMMNDGARLDEIIHAVRVPQSLLDKPYLTPIYDEPEFVVRNIWRLYGGWYDGNPANLKPAPELAVARELAALSGGAGRLAERAAELSDAGDHRLACHLAEWAALAAPDDAEVHGHRSHVYENRRTSELSLMARNIYRDAKNQSDSKTGDTP